MVRMVPAVVAGPDRRIAGQGPGQRGSTARDARPDGAGGNLEDLGDRGVVQITHVAEHHRKTELLG